MDMPELEYYAKRLDITFELETGSITIIEQEEPNDLPLNLESYSKGIDFTDDLYIDFTFRDGTTLTLEMEEKSKTEWTAILYDEESEGENKGSIDVNKWYPVIVNMTE